MIFYFCICTCIYTNISVTQNRRDSFSWVKKQPNLMRKCIFSISTKLAVSYEFVGGGRDFGYRLFHGYTHVKFLSCYYIL